MLGRGCTPVDAPPTWTSMPRPLTSSVEHRRPKPTSIRHWFEVAGLGEIAFAGAQEPYGVGLNRSTRAISPTGAIPDWLFTLE
jgi:hypothetical protein